MEQVELVAYLREKRGKQANKKLRKSGLIPAVVYGRNEPSLPLSCHEKNLEAVLHTSARENVIVSLKIMDTDKQKKKKVETVIIKDIQHDPVKGNILHVDFNHISLRDKITVKVPLETKGEAPGVKADGLLEHILWELEVECLPTQIPEKFVVNVSDLQIGDMIHVKDIPVPEGVQILNDPDQVAISIEPPKAVEVEVVAEEEKEQEEPEVIKQKKPEEIEEEEKSTKAEKEK